MIPLVDLNAQYQTIKDQVHEAITRVLESGQFVLGPEVAAFEEEFASYSHAGYAFGTNSGTSALHLALLAAGVGPGDEVITVPFTFVASVSAIEYAGATPVFVDVDPVSYTMDPTQLEAAITDRTRAILPVHLYGQSADMEPILEIARRHGLIVIEDAAQAHGAEYKGQRVGSIGDIGCFSFYPGKNLGAYGEAGMVVTSNSVYADRIRMLRDWGQERKYIHSIKGFNYRMENIQGAILRVKLRHIEAWTEARIRHAALYSDLLSGTGIPTPETLPERRHVFHIYAVRVDQREGVQDALLNNGIQTGIHYPVPVHLLGSHADLSYPRSSFPYSEQAADEVLSLPLYPELTNEQIEKVAASLRDAVTAASRANETTGVAAT